MNDTTMNHVRAASPGASQDAFQVTDQATDQAADARQAIVLEAIDLRVGYAPRGQPEQTLVELPNLQLRAGELVCLLGPNGIGKSTLMRTLTGFQPPLAGRVELDGRLLNEISAQMRAQLVSIVLTNRFDVAAQTVFELAALGRYPYTGWFGRLAPRDREIVWWALDVTGARALANRRVDELSDGQRQRVLIARALAQASRIMLLDEPTAFLDLPGRVEIMGLLRRLAHSTGCAIIVSSHDLDLALRTADRVWLLAPPRRLIQGGPEDVVLSGALAQTFVAKDVHFDLQTGAFHFRHPWRGAVHFQTTQGETTQADCTQASKPDDSLLVTWTQRMLARIGFRTVTAANARAAPQEETFFPTVQLDRSGAAPRWWVVHPDRPAQAHDSLYALAHTLSRWADQAATQTATQIATQANEQKTDKQKTDEQTDEQKEAVT